MRKRSSRPAKNDIARFIYLRSDILIFLFTSYLKIIAFSLLTGIPVTPLAAILSLAGLCLLAFLFSLTGDTVFRTIRVIFWDSLLSIAIMADLTYSRYFNDVISWPALSGAMQVGAVSSSVKALFSSWDLLFFADIPLITVLLVLRIRRARKKKPFIRLSSYRRLRRNLFRATLAGVLIAAIVSGWAVYFQSPRLFTAFTENRQAEFPMNYNYVANLGIANFHVFDTALLFRQIFFKPKVSDKKLAEVRTWFERREREPSGENRLQGIARGKNLIIILVESLQDFVIDLEIDGQPVTPNLNAWARKSYHNRGFFHQTAQGRTIDAEFVSLASLHPLRAGAVSFLYPHHEYDSLAKVLKRHGYFTALAQAYKSNFWNEDLLCQSLGFDRHITENDFRVDEVIAMGLSDAHYLDQMMEKLAEMPEPFLAFIVTLSSHHPYNELPEKYRTLKLGKWEGTLMGDYLASVHYTDTALGEFLEKFSRSGLYENSVLVILGDHDAGLGREELAAINGVKATGFDLKMLDKVPFIVHLPGMNGPFSEETWGGTIDIAPSLLYLLGIDSRGNYFMGRNVFAESEPACVVFRNGSVLSNGLLYLQSADSRAEGSCYTVPGGEHSDSKNCAPLREKGRRELELSDLIIRSNLIEKLRNRQK